MKITTQPTDIHPRLQFDRRSGRTARRFPKTDYNFQPATQADFISHGSLRREENFGKSAPSFRDISRHYFATEARAGFVAEALLFTVITLTATVPIIDQWHVLAGLLQAIGLH